MPVHRKLLVPHRLDRQPLRMPTADVIHSPTWRRGDKMADGGELFVFPPADKDEDVSP